MKIFALTFFLLVFVFASCKTNQTAEVFQDKDRAWTTKDITQNRDLTQYEQGGLFWGRTRFGGTFGNEKDKLEGEKKVRDFIWQHWIEKKRGYIKFNFANTDTSSTTHYFIEPNEKGDWIIVRKTIFQLSDGKFEQNEDALNSVERLENKANGDWFLVSKSSNGEIIERLPVY
jgi:hypothetical protein